jgi:hypothetical protein
MSTKRRVLMALGVFVVGMSLLAIAEAKKPPKVAVLHKPTVAQQGAAVQDEPAPVKKPKRAKKFMPVADFGDY